MICFWKLGVGVKKSGSLSLSFSEQFLLFHTVGVVQAGDDAWS